MPFQIKDENLRKTYIKSSWQVAGKKNKRNYFRDAGDVYPLSMLNFDKDYISAQLLKWNS